MSIQQALAIYIFANIGLVFSLALPAAGMINHLLVGTASFGRGALLWLLASLACILFTTPFFFLFLRKRVKRSANE